MASRSLNRVLGETSLERKCRFLFGICLTVLIAGSFLWYGRKTDQLVYDTNRRVGNLLVGNALNELHLVNLNTGDIGWNDAGEWLVEDSRSKAYTWQIILPRRNDPRGQFDQLSPIEQALVQRWEGTTHVPSEDDAAERPFEARSLPSQREYQYYEPIYAKEACISCHRVLGEPAMRSLKVGDFMGIVQVVIPDAETVNAQNLNRAILYTTAIVTAFFAMLALYVIVRYVIVKPLKHLRDVSEEISRGNMTLRADIHTGDEFEDLGVAFNRMLRHLIASQEELRKVNGDLDGKVDQLAQANMRLYEMNRLKSDFLATVSHELRTPLNSIIGFSDVLGSIDGLDDTQVRYVKNIQRSGRMLLEMINDILDLAKIESGKMKIRLSEFQIDRVIAAQCDMARPLTEKKNIDLEYQVEPNLPDLVQDQGKVQQILNNLLSNAIKFTPEGGRIDISASREASGSLRLVVDDTGVGIAEEDQVAIFEKFRQGTTVLPGGDAMTREYSGTGLGLSIVKELCRLLGGEIELESELGKGSTFIVRLPWTRTEQPDLDSDLSSELEDLTRPRLLGHHQESDENVPTSTSTSS